MDNLIKLPFIETNISLLDFNKLENNGYLRPIFIELLKAEKIKNIIPTEYQVKASAKELLLNNNIDQFNREKIINTMLTSLIRKLLNMQVIYLILSGLIQLLVILINQLHL